MTSSIAKSNVTKIVYAVMEKNDNECFEFLRIEIGAYALEVNVYDAITEDCIKTIRLDSFYCDELVSGFIDAIEKL